MFGSKNYDSAERGMTGDIVLSIARRLYLVVSVISLVVAIAGLAAAAFFQFGIWIPTPQKPVPPEASVNADSLDLSIVDAHFVPPHDIRFVVTAGTISRPVNDQQLLGYFDADAANGLASFPNDFAVIGGKDADLFTRALASSSVLRTGLLPTPALVSQINEALSGLTAVERRAYTIQVVGRDSFGNLSRPEEISFTLVLAPAGMAPAETTQMTPLEALARDIALVIDPSQSPRYFEAYKRALHLPRQCNADRDDPIFVANYRRAFDHVRSRLSGGNAEQFYRGVCDGWHDVMAKVQAAEQARNAVIAENAGLRMAAGMAHTAAAITRNAALFFAAGAFMFFMWISLSLAFLAIENHTRAMRAALEKSDK